MLEVTTKRKTSNGRNKLFRTHRLPGVLLGLALLGAGVTIFATPRLAMAGVDARTPKQRTVEGSVTSKSDAPLPGAVVYLKDTRSLSVKSYLTDEGGRFHFGQLADGADYEVWAEQNGSRSSTKSISQFNSKLNIQFTLKIDTGK